MKKFAFLFIACSFFFTACNKEDSIPAPTAEEDRQTILDYMAENNLTGVENSNGTFVVTEVAGTGVSPTISNQVEVRYVGRLLNGVIFDQTPGTSTRTFPMSGVINGFRDGLLQMNVGGSSQIIIPSNQGYGASGAGALVPPHSILIFDTELVGIL